MLDRKKKVNTPLGEEIESNVTKDQARTASLHKQLKTQLEQLNCLNI